MRGSLTIRPSPYLPKHSLNMCVIIGLSTKAACVVYGQHVKILQVGEVCIVTSARHSVLRRATRHQVKRLVTQSNNIHECWDKRNIKMFSLHLL